MKGWITLAAGSVAVIVALAVIGAEEGTVITSYSIHYTKLYEPAGRAPASTMCHMLAMEVSRAAPITAPSPYRPASARLFVV